MGKRVFNILIIMLVASFSGLNAQFVNPVKWTVALDMTDGNKGEIVMTADILSGWHMYSNEVDPDIGPTPLSVDWSKLEGVTLEGKLTADKVSHKEFDEMFGANLSWWTERVVVKPFQRVALTM